MKFRINGQPVVCNIGNSLDKVTGIDKKDGFGQNPLDIGTYFASSCFATLSSASAKFLRKDNNSPFFSIHMAAHYQIRSKRSSRITSDWTMPEYMFCLIPNAVTKVSCRVSVFFIFSRTRASLERRVLSYPLSMANSS